MRTRSDSGLLWPAILIFVYMTVSWTLKRNINVITAAAAGFIAHATSLVDKR